MVTYMTAMATTIQVSEKLLDTLKKRKLYDRESYEEILWDLIEDSIEVNGEAKQRIEQARAEIEKGKFYTHEQVKKRLGL